jgi:hypothetical protein
MTEYAKVTVTFYNGVEKFLGLNQEDTLFYRQVREGDDIELLHQSGVWVYAVTQKPIEVLQNEDAVEEGKYSVKGEVSSEEEAAEWAQSQFQ